MNPHIPRQLVKMPSSRKNAARRLASLLGLLLILSPLVQAGGGAVITYQKVFKGSSPEFVEIKVGDDGTASYDIRQLSEPPAPLPLQVSPAIRAKIFQLAAALHNFAGIELDVHRRIAYLGRKTFRYQKDSEVHETQFNYTTNRPASQLLTIFEGLAQQQEDLLQLEKELKYDRLGVNDALLQLEDDLSHRTLPEPDQFLPVLNRIANDSRVIDMARKRARSLAERIRTSENP
jgi:hypothetical protein